MRTTLTIDDDLFRRVMSLAEPGIEKSQLVTLYVKAFIQLQTARRLAALGGQVPYIEHTLRRPIESTNA